MLVYCLIVIDDFRVPHRCHSKAPLAGNGVILVKGGNAVVAPVWDSLRASR